MIHIRPYNPEKDYEAIPRIWEEVGWIRRSKALDAAANSFVSSGRALVAEIDGTTECQVSSMPGAMRYLETELHFSGVTAVATGYVARKRGLAARLTARLVAEDTAEGIQVMGLGMFEQGFYNQLGFGTAPYTRWVSFDPAQLQIAAKARIPKRLTSNDWEAVHAARLTRMRGHGACILFPPDVSRVEMIAQAGFGLGYFDGPQGELSHYLWMLSENADGHPNESGPYTVQWMTYQNGTQLQELVALLHTLGDQIRLVKLKEPYGVQFQDFIRQPFRFQQLTSEGKFDNTNQANAYQQYRICNLEGCLAQTHLPGETVRFNLVLTDPVSAFLDNDVAWRGLSGNYIVTLGPESAAIPGNDAALPTLKATVNAFTRLWLGVRQPSYLALSDALSGPPELLTMLDRVLRLPVPDMDWDF
ncbi:MAG: GNAT family N-acetyltransferase [Anaerolineae bacterium]|nr:GNAT family N-acetyltransferase [Anaerolineae bacterium]